MCARCADNATKMCVSQTTLELTCNTCEAFFPLGFGGRKTLSMDNPVPMTALRSNPAFRRELASYSAASASKPNPASLIFLAEKTLFNSGRENPMSKSSESQHQKVPCTTSVPCRSRSERIQFPRYRKNHILKRKAPGLRIRLCSSRRVL